MASPDQKTANPAAPPAETLPATITPGPGSMVRQDFDGQEIAVQGETASSAAAAQASAVVQARYIMAMRRPRDWDEVRVRLLRECQRPGFAESAWYRKPMGDGAAEGLSIRFAEAAVRCMTNLLPEAMVTWDDPHKRIVMVTVTDLESNVCYPKSVVIEKTVERKFLKKGQLAIRTRINNQGNPVYIVPATDDEVLSKENNLISKAIRNGALRLLPGDIQDECKRTIKKILDGAAAKDPDAERKKVADAFAELGVMPAALKEYLGHDLAACSPAELVALRSLYTGIKTGETTWAEAVGEKQDAAEQTTAPEPEKKSALDNLADRLKPEPPATPVEHASHSEVEIPLQEDTLAEAAAAEQTTAPEPDPRTPEGNPFARGEQKAREKRQRSLTE